MPETVVKDRNVDGVDGVRNRVDWKGRSVMECDGKVRRWCRNDVGASGMDLEKFYMTVSCNGRQDEGSIMKQRRSLGSIRIGTRSNS